LNKTFIKKLYNSKYCFTWLYKCSGDVRNVTTLMEMTEMKRLISGLVQQAWLGGGVLMAGIACAHADTTGGCADSPENPTVVLTLLGLAAAAVPKVRARIRKFRGE
jgi:XrtJ-associated TM-motif-TM protein